MPRRAATRSSPPKKYHNVPVLESTWVRLRDYKMVSATYDEVLNRLMDSVPLEMVTQEVLAEHRRRMRSHDWQDWQAMRSQVERDAVQGRGRGSGKARVRKASKPRA